MVRLLLNGPSARSPVLLLLLLLLLYSFFPQSCSCVKCTPHCTSMPDQPGVRLERPGSTGTDDIARLTRMHWHTGSTGCAPTARVNRDRLGGVGPQSFHSRHGPRTFWFLIKHEAFASTRRIIDASQNVFMTLQNSLTDDQDVPLQENAGGFIISCTRNAHALVLFHILYQSVHSKVLEVVGGKRRDHIA